LVLVLLFIGLVVQGLLVKKLRSELLDFAKDSLILLVNRGFGPSREHDDKVEFTDTLLASIFRLHLSKSIDQIIVLVLSSLVNKLEVLGLVSDRATHVLVRKHRSAGLSQLGLKGLILGLDVVHELLLHVLLRLHFLLHLKVLGLKLKVVVSKLLVSPRQVDVVVLQEVVIVHIVLVEFIELIKAG
jgi:hypothetical protein